MPDGVPVIRLVFLMGSLAFVYWLATVAMLVLLIAGWLRRR